uniref:Uncharacterized protein n=1 Tax=Myotis myotis TaxID=51298 RepID=A0A7J7VYZ0_MYOMY|nr:hypothetical protein mMyoMyo1_012220 [Myotis myotis]
MSHTCTVKVYLKGCLRDKHSRSFPGIYLGHLGFAVKVKSSRWPAADPGPGRCAAPTGKRGFPLSAILAMDSACRGLPGTAKSPVAEPRHLLLQVRADRPG